MVQFEQAATIMTYAYFMSAVLYLRGTTRFNMPPACLRKSFCLFTWIHKDSLGCDRLLLKKQTYCYIRLALHIHSSLSLSLSLSLFPVTPTLEHRASGKRCVLLQFLNPKRVGRTPWTGDQPIARPLPIHTQNKQRQRSIPWVRFEPMIPAFEGAKRVHALDRAATVTGPFLDVIGEK
jgi:hypothetical protein